MENGELIGNGKYTINTVDNVKDYYISQINYSGAFGTKDVLCATGEGNDRFYVMALTDFNAGTYYFWYRRAVDYTDGFQGKMTDYETATLKDFGAGKHDTQTMIEKWNNKVYGEQDVDLDVWGEIQTKFKEGWFVPSRGEWSAFAEELGITEENCEEKNLKLLYWSSSQQYTYNAWCIVFHSTRMSGNNVNDADSPVRLSITF